MKKLFYLIVAICMCHSTSAEAQLLGKLKKAAENAVIKKSEQKVTKETEKTMDGLLNKKDPKENPDIQGDATSANPNENVENETSETTDGAPEAKMWSKYNFVPGDVIIFEDDLSKEENGEFPSRWDLLQGNAENASLNGEAVIKMDNNTFIAPLMNKEKYLPEVFTIEFDAYYNDVYNTYQEYNVRFYPGTSGSGDVSDGVLYPLEIKMHGARIQKTETAGSQNRVYENYLETNGDVPGWKHIAISYNEGALKVFIDEDRILNIPKIKIDPGIMSIQAYTVGDMVSAIRNIRIAEGGKKLYDRVVTDGKFVTRGIMFDTGKASLKPESMGVINEIANMMKEHQDLKFSIEGHTDSYGEESYNLHLSEQRANAVKEALAGIGIEATRMQSKGLGEGVPVSDNSNPEGKANNRRVEFVKI